MHKIHFLRNYDLYMSASDLIGLSNDHKYKQRYEQLEQISSHVCYTADLSIICQ